MKLFFIRYIKIIFIYLRLDVFFHLFSGFFSNLNYLSKLSSWIRKNRKIGYNDFPSKWNYEKRYPLYKWVTEKENLVLNPVNYLEFGVAGGQSFRWFLSQNADPESRFYGFDTFTGLPEDFGVYKKGMFNNNTAPPQIDDKRVKFYQGLFQQTLPGFLNEMDDGCRSVFCNTLCPYIISPFPEKR